SSLSSGANFIRTVKLIIGKKSFLLLVPSIRILFNSLPGGPASSLEIMFQGLAQRSDPRSPGTWPQNTWTVGGSFSLPVNLVQRSRKIGEHDRLPPIRARRNHGDLRSAFPLLEVQVVARRLRQLVEFGNPIRRLAPTLQFCIDRLDLLKAVHIGG